MENLGGHRSFPAVRSILTRSENTSRPEESLMNIKHVFAIDSHAAGEAARIVIGPLMWKRFDNMTEKKEYFKRNTQVFADL